MEVDQSITRFVYEWFDDLSAHEPADRLLPRVYDEGLEMVFPERTLRCYDDFIDWYEEVGKAFADQTHTVEEVRAEQRGDLIELAITVVWTATDTADRTRSSFRAHQTWRLRRDDVGDLRIVTYRVDDLSPLSATPAEQGRGVAVSTGEQTADYVVVGAGSSGAVIANRLSADPSRTVLLLEAGDRDVRPELHRTDAGSVIGLLTSDWSPQIDWGYATEPEPGLDGRTVPVARGKVLGGSSSVNALMWVRGHRDDYDRWSREGNAGWSFEDVLPYFRRAENYAQAPAGSALRGAGGPVRVRDLDDPSPVARSFVAATRELGFGSGDGDRGPDGFDYNGAAQEGGGFFYQTTRTPDNERSSTATAYLTPVLDRPNLRIEVRAQATRLLFTGRRVTGVEYVQDGVVRTVGVDREVVVSAGAFESPKLLMLSGVGPAAELRKLGLPVVQDLPGVGENLQDHPFVPLCFQALQEHPAGALLSEAGMFTRTAAGAAAAGGPSGTAGTSGSGQLPSPDLQFTFGPIKFLPPTAPAELWEGPGFTFAPILLHPASRGRVLLRSTDPADTAVVHANFLQQQADVDVLAEGLTLARELAATTAFDKVRGAELAPGDAVTGREELRDFIRANTSTLWHPVGTCRMGDDPMAVVDAELQVHGLEGLRVADASVMPHIVSGNTNAACVMIGEKAADLIAHTSSHRTTGRTS